MLHLACSPAAHPPSWELLHISGSMGYPVWKGADGVTPLLQLFKGKFYHCLGVDIRNITNRSDCVAANYKWVHHKYNFDNLGQVSVPTGPVSDGNPSRDCLLLYVALPWAQTQCHESLISGPGGAVIWHGYSCRSCVTSGLVSG